VIYFAQPTDGGPVKIGFSGNVEARVRQLESYYRKPLAVLAVMDGGREDEAEIHARFDHLRLQGLGSRGVRPEQFMPAPDLMEFIGLPLFVNQGDVELMSAPDARTKPVRLDLTPELHQRLRVVAAKQGKPMAVFAREVVKKVVNELYGE
jgi:hypothetical protein